MVSTLDDELSSAGWRVTVDKLVIVPILSFMSFQCCSKAVRPCSGDVQRSTQFLEIEILNPNERI